MDFQEAEEFLWPDMTSEEIDKYVNEEIRKQCLSDVSFFKKAMEMNIVAITETSYFPCGPRAHRGEGFWGTRVWWVEPVFKKKFHWELDFMTFD